jgi:hypothetical protein
MVQRDAPEGTPLSPAEWGKLSDASRRWVLDVAAAMKEEEGRSDEAESGAGKREAQESEADSSEQ